MQLQIWFLQFPCPMVEVMVMVCQEGGKPMKHRVQWVNKRSGLCGMWECPGVSLWVGGSFTPSDGTLWIISPLVEVPKN